MKSIITVSLVLFICFNAYCEDKRNGKAAKEIEAKIVIPKTLDEAHAQLEKNLPKEELAKIDKMKSEDDMSEYHFGFGTGIRNSWGLWGDSPLSKHLRSLGFIHADDMSSVILDTFWCKRHNKDFRIKERAEYYKTYWKENEWPGDDAVNPNDNSKIKWTTSITANNKENPMRRIFLGRSVKTDRVWAFQHDKGVYAPDAKLLKQLNKDKNTF